MSHRRSRRLPGGRNPGVLAAAFALGLRQGEALGLAWDDVNPEKGTVRLRRTHLSAGRGQRVCPVPQAAAVLLLLRCRGAARGGS